MRSIFIAFACLFLNAFSAASAEKAVKATQTTPAPQWYLDDVAFLTRDSGRWIADNSNYMNEETEPFEAYGLEWKAGYANSMTGRLFGIKDGEETGDFWRFRQYWHPGKGKAVVEQFGFGDAVGVGTMWREDHANRMDQLFYGPDGSVTRAGHRAENPDDDTHVTESFDIVDGEWRPRRIYTWTRAASAAEESGE